MGLRYVVFLLLFIIIFKGNCQKKQAEIHCASESVVKIKNNVFETKRIILGELSSIGPDTYTYMVYNDSVVVEGVVYEMEKPITGVEIYLCERLKQNHKQKKEHITSYKFIKFIGYNDADTNKLIEAEIIRICSRGKMKGVFKATYKRGKEWLVFWHPDLKEGSTLYLTPEDNLPLGKSE